jgi:hypothetical protein
VREVGVVGEYADPEFGGEGGEVWRLGVQRLREKGMLRGW